MATYAQLNNNLDTLSLSKIKEILPSYLDDNGNEERSLIDNLYDLTKAEIEFRDERARKINIMVSSSPYHKTVKDFDFSYQPTINKQKILDLSTLRFIDDKSNIIFIGSPGVGKTHPATALGIEAASQRISTYFINFAELMEKYKRAAKENRVEQIVKYYLKYTVLIIDEDISQWIKIRHTLSSSL